MLEETQEETNIMTIKKDEFRSIKVPRHRLSPLKKHWEQIVKMIIGKLHLMIR